MMTVMERAAYFGTGEQYLQDIEVLQMLLGNKRAAVKLLKEMPREKLYDLSETDMYRLIPIVGEKQAARVIAAVELGKRIAKSGAKRNADTFENQEDIANYVMEDMRYLTQEHFNAMYLTVKNQLITVKNINVGSLDASPVSGREVFKFAIEYNAGAVVLLHNHPSGDPKPSKTDIQITHQLLKASKVLHIAIHDHIIIGDGIYYSLKQHGYM